MGVRCRSQTGRSICIHRLPDSSFRRPPSDWLKTGEWAIRAETSKGQVVVQVARFLVMGKYNRTNTIRNSVDPHKRVQVAVFAAAQVLRMRIMLAELPVGDVIINVAGGLVIQFKKRLLPR